MAKKILNFNHDISSSSRHRASFLACKEEIFEALENGWTAKQFGQNFMMLMHLMDRTTLFAVTFVAT